MKSSMLLKSFTGRDVLWQTCFPPWIVLPLNHFTNQEGKWLRNKGWGTRAREDHVSLAWRAEDSVLINEGPSPWGKDESLSLGEGRGLDWQGRDHPNPEQCPCGAVCSPTEDAGIRSSSYQPSHSDKRKGKHWCWLRSNSNTGDNEAYKQLGWPSTKKNTGKRGREAHRLTLLGTHLFCLRSCFPDEKTW